MSNAGLGYTEGVGTKMAVHVISEDSEARTVERISPGAGVLATWDWSADKLTVNATGSFGDIDTQGKGRIVIAARAAIADVDVGDVFSFRLAYYAVDDGLIGFSGTVEPEFTEYSDATYQYSTIAAFANDVGAAAVAFYLTAFPGTATSFEVIVKAL